MIGVFTADDMKSVVPLRAQSRMRGYYATPLRPLADSKVRYVGEPVVAIVAETRYLAEDAAELIEIEYEPLPAATDIEEAAADGAPLLHEDAGSNVVVAREFARGDVDMDIAQAAVTVGGRFRFHRKTPMAIENRACLAEYRAGRLTCTPPPRFPASFATRCARRSTCRPTACGWLRPTSAAGSAARRPCIPRRSSSPRWRASSAAR